MTETPTTTTAPSNQRLPAPLQQAFAMLDGLADHEAKHASALELVQGCFDNVGAMISPVVKAYKDCLTSHWHHVHVPEAEFVILSKALPARADSHAGVTFATVRYMRTSEQIHAVFSPVRIADYVGRYDPTRTTYDVVTDEQTTLSYAMPFPEIGQFVLPIYIPGTFGKEPRLKPALALAEAIVERNHLPMASLMMALLAEKRAREELETERGEFRHIRPFDIQPDGPVSRALGQMLGTLTSLAAPGPQASPIELKKFELVRQELFRHSLASGVHLTMMSNPSLLPDVLQILRAHPECVASTA